MSSSPDYLGGDTDRIAFLNALGEYDEGDLGSLIHSMGNPASLQNSSILKIGSSGAAVTALHEKLKMLGYNVSGSSFTEQTKTAVIDFQNRSRLTADGIAGAMTQSALDEAVTRQQQAAQRVAAATAAADQIAATRVKESEDKRRRRKETTGQFLKKGLEFVKAHGGDLTTVAAESIAPGSTNWEREMQRAQAEEEQKKEGWGALQWGLVAGGVVVLGVGIYFLARKK